jgi:TolA-binding protein
MKQEVNTETTTTVINVTKGNIERLKQLQQQIQILNNEVNNLVAVILDAKEVDFKDKRITLAEDFTTITIE